MRFDSFTFRNVYETGKVEILEHTCQEVRPAKKVLTPVEKHTIGQKRPAVWPVTQESFYIENLNSLKPWSDFFSVIFAQKVGAEPLPKFTDCLRAQTLGTIVVARQLSHFQLTGLITTEIYRNVHSPCNSKTEKAQLTSPQSSGYNCNITPFLSCVCM